MPLPNGLYDLLLTEGLEPLLTALAPGQQQLQPLSGDASDYLVDTLTRQLGALLESLPGEGAEQAQHQLELVNALLVWLRQRVAGHDGAAASTTATIESVVDLIAPPARVLRAIHHQQQLPTAPELGLAVPWLLTAGKGSPALLHEIRRELASSDRVDILVSFITVSGVRKLRDVLQQITA
jgi:hypothetical protein